MFNGTEQWQYMNGVFRLLNNDLIFENSSAETLMCTHYKARSPYETINLNTDNSICTSISHWGSAYKSFAINDKRFTNANDFKAYLIEQKVANTPVAVELNIKDEEIEAYTEEQQEAYNKLKELYSYQEVTHITCEDEIKTTQKVTYSIEPKIEVENKGNIASRPILKLIKTLDDYVDMTINQVRLKYNFLENEDYVEINCENKEVKYDNLNRNRQIEIGYEFPKLNVGNNKITLNSGDCIIETKRKDRWL